MTRKDMLGKAQTLFQEAKVLVELEEISAEDAERRDKMIVDAHSWQQRASQLLDIEEAAKVFQLEKDAPQKKTQLASGGQWLQAVHKFYDSRYRGPLPNLGGEFQRDEGEEVDNSWLSKSAQQHKDLLEQTGAIGGFLVPVEFRPELLAALYEANIIKERATVIQMRRRQLDIPTLDQTGTAAGTTRQHGGIVATWTEEATEKDETEPNFRQVQLVAHKLVCYTEASDELLADEAVGLVAFLSGPMGWAGAIKWEEEFTFLQGTGAGQPLGVLNAGATIVVPRATALQINIADIFQMVSQHHGDNPIWHISRGAMPQLLNLNGPAANPSYFWQPNAREGAPGTLMGFPITWTEKLPALGTQGDILLADWSFYLVGDRQATTIDSSQHFRFRNDLTAWRAVHRVDGQPWLSVPITLADGVTTISPFVILGDVAS